MHMVHDCINYIISLELSFSLINADEALDFTRLLGLMTGRLDEFDCCKSATEV